MSDEMTTAEAVEEVKPETIEEYVARMAQEDPEAIVTAGEFSDSDKLPGYEEVTFFLAKAYSLKWGMIQAMSEIKREYFEPHVVDTQVGTHVIRGFNRQQWARVQKRMIQEAKDRMQAHQTEDSDPQWAEADIQMRGEELIAIEGCVWPKYDKAKIRMIPTGVISYLAESILRACGHQDQGLPPLPLK